MGVCGVCATWSVSSHWSIKDLIIVSPRELFGGQDRPNSERPRQAYIAPSGSLSVHSRFFLHARGTSHITVLFIITEDITTVCVTANKCLQTEKMRKNILTTVTIHFEIVRLDTWTKSKK